MNSRRLYCGDFLCLALAFFSPLTRCLAQGSTENILRTGGGAPLTTVESRVLLPSAGTPALLNFQFGFGTDEVFAPGVFFDSFTVSVIDTNSGAVAVIVTADASGFVWAPPLEGGVTLEESDIEREATAFPGLQPVFANQFAYDVSFTLPSAFQSSSVNVVFDLFDNQNAVASLGFFSGLVAIPEPSACTLLMVGALLGAWWNQRRRRSSS